MKRRIVLWDKLRTKKIPLNIGIVKYKEEATRERNSRDLEDCMKGLREKKGQKHEIQRN